MMLHSSTSEIYIFNNINIVLIVSMLVFVSSVTLNPILHSEKRYCSVFSSRFDSFILCLLGFLLKKAFSCLICMSLVLFCVDLVMMVQKVVLLQISFFLILNQHKMLTQVLFHPFKYLHHLII